MHGSAKVENPQSRFLQHYGKPTNWSLKHVVGRDLIGLRRGLLRCVVTQYLKTCKTGFYGFMENQHNGALGAR